MAGSNSQTVIPPACVAGGALNSPHIQIRASRGQQSIASDGLVLRAVATPARNQELQPWSVDCAIWLAAEGEDGRYRGRARFLDRLSVTSVQDAVDGLNRRIIWCPEDFCVVCSSADRAYYLVYRKNRLDNALGKLGVSREELSLVAATTGRSNRESEGRKSITEAIEAPGRPSISEVSGAPKVVRQTSMPTRATTSLRGRGEKGIVAVPTTTPPRQSGGICEECPADSPPFSAFQTNGPTPTGALVMPRAGCQGQGPPSVVGTPAAPPPVLTQQAPGAVAVAASAYPRFSTPGPLRNQGMPSYQSYTPVASGPLSAAPIAQAAGQHLVVAARPFAAAAPTARGGVTAETAQRSGGEHRNSITAQQAPLTKRVSSEEGQVMNNAEDGQTLDENTWPASFRELLEAEKITFSDLTLVESLGSGEFGQVFRGFYRGEEVAIKQLYWDDTLMTEIVLQDLAKEIESFRHLRHKRLVRFIGACLEMPPCLVTQYMPGGSLHHLLHVRKLKLPPLHALNMCMQLADGVMYLHSQNPCVVHRDLKSLNVVLDLNLNIKICDFGLTESMERTHITKRNNGGSPRYMAPELFDCKTKITEKIDIWAMGCIFNEIFSGPLPYANINTLADLTREMLVHRRPPEVSSHMFEEIQQLITSCLDFDPSRRPTSKMIFEQLKSVKKALRDAGKLEGLSLATS